MNKEKGKVLHMNPDRRKRPVAPRPIKAERKKSRGWKHTESLQEYKRGMAISRSTTVVAGLFFVAVLFYLVQTLIAFMTTPEIPVEMVRMGSVDSPMVLEGIIIRDESVYTADREGVVHFYVNSYVRVQPGSLVSSIQNVQAVAGIRQSISQVEEQIIQLQDIVGDLSAADPAIRQINSQIQNMVDSRLHRHIELNIGEAYALRDSIVQNVNIRNQMIVAENLGIRAEPELNYQFLLGELDANRLPVHINGGGILAPVVDGFEEQLTFESMYMLSREQTRQNVDFNQIIPRREVEPGDNMFKIVNSNNWFIAAYIPNELIEGLSVGSRYTLYIEGRRAPLGVFVHHIDQGFQDSFVIFRSNAYMIDFLNKRSIFFRTTDTVQHGLRIANTAITEHKYLAIPLECIHEGEPRYVVRVLGYEELIIPVVVADQDYYYAFVLPSELLAVGNALRDRENPGISHIIPEERLSQGVFRVNSGIAEFIPLVLPEDAPVGGVHTIVDPALNPRLRLYDHIVTDASLVEDGDIVFSGVR